MKVGDAVVGQRQPRDPRAVGVDGDRHAVHHQRRVATSDAAEEKGAVVRPDDVGRRGIDDVDRQRSRDGGGRGKGPRTATGGTGQGPE
jgi:hypothetical protein